MRYSTITPLDRRRTYLAGVATILIFAIGLIFGQYVFALTISPVRMELRGSPGTNVVGEIALFNEQEETKTFYSSTQNFEARGESGVPYFLPERKGLATWISVEDQVTLAAGERKTIPFTITIPKNAEPGGHFAAIFWSVTPPQQDKGQVAVSGRLGMLILLSIGGELKEGGGLIEFGSQGGRVVSSLPITFAYRFSNDGSERVKPSGELKIKNMLGFTTVTLDANRGSGNVLPRSVRKFEIVWFEKGQDKLAVYSPPAEEVDEKKGFFSAVKNQWQNFALGPYKAELNLSYGKLSESEASNQAQASYRFFVIPWQLLSIIFVILAVVSFLGFIGLKRYNRWIIAKASQIQKK